jgi:hypothetical protein
MKIYPRAIRTGLSLARLIWLAGLVFALPHRAVGYDIPDFEKIPFSADGINVPTDTRAELLAALVALASNFPDAKVADEDLSEKALSLALRLDPYHEDSRSAHEALKSGRSPAATPYFESLSSVSEALWRASRTLATPVSNPDELTLAPYLAELSLVVHPDPADKRLLEFLEMRGDKPALKWSSFLSLHHDSASSAKVRDLARRSQQLQEHLLAAKPPIPETEPTRTAVVETPVAEEEPASRRILSRSVIASVEGPGEVYPVPGKFEISVLTLSASQMQRMVERSADPPKATPARPIVTEGRSAIPLAELPLTLPDLKSRNLTLPPNIRIELGFHPTGTLRSSPRFCRITGSSLFHVLFAEALDQNEWNEDFLLVESSPMPPDPEGRQNTSQTLQTCFSSSAAPFALIPAPLADSLLDMLLDTEDLSILFTKELVAIQDSAAAIALMSQPRSPALTDASNAFAEIKAVLGKMTLVDLARNPKVQERLDAILAGYPNHLSARLMLEFGRSPISAASAMRPFITKIDEVITPYFSLENSDSQANSLAAALEADATRLFKLRSTIPQDARDYLDACDNVLEAAELFLSLTNKTTALGDQRLRETRAAIVAAKAERAKLGVQ